LRFTPAQRVAIGLAIVAISVASSPLAARAGSTGQAPGFLKTVGGPNHAALYPSGVEVAPDGTIVAADTGNDRVAKFRPDGSLVWSVGTHGEGVGQFSEPRDIAVDPLGNVYVADATNKRIVKLSPSGAWLDTFTGPADRPLGVTMGVSADNGLLYVSDVGKNAVRVLDPVTGNEVLEVDSAGACDLTALRDADADAAGNIWVAGYDTNELLKLSPTGACLGAWGSTGTAPGQFRAPYGVTVATDPVLGEEAVYVADANNSRIQEFQLDGSFVAQVGTAGEPTQTGTFSDLRRVAVAADGSVWGADLWGWRLVRFQRTPTGYAYAQTIGTPLPPSTDTRVFHAPRNMSFFGDGSFVVADTVHQSFVRMSSTGSYVNTCGERGSKLGQFNWPRGVAVDPSTGQVWVADTKQYRMQVVAPSNCDGIAKFGTKGTAIDQFNWVDAVAIRSSDGRAVIADTKNDRIAVYDVSSETPLAVYGEAGSTDGRFESPAGIAVDPRDGTVLVADTGNDRVVRLSVTSGGVVGWVATYSAGLTQPEGVAVDSSGRIYVADTGANRVVVLSSAGAVLGTFTGPTALDQPAAVAVAPNGDVYVADTYNDRIQVFRWGSTGGGGPAISVTDAARKEGNSGTLPMTFTVSLSAASTKQVSVGYWTASGTAIAGEDFVAASGTVVFSPGQISKPVTVMIKGDTKREGYEQYQLRLQNPVNATFADKTGVGTIRNDD
jgi:DNA-binding beta-propeller fold protein YncE